jgi:hypothetical protein
MNTQSVANICGNRFHCKRTVSVDTISNSCFTTQGHRTKMLRNAVPSAASKLTGIEVKGRQKENFITVLTCMSHFNLLFQHLYQRDTINTLLNNATGTQQCNTCSQAAEP